MLFKAEYADAVPSLGDKGYDDDGIRSEACCHGTNPLIPTKRNRELQRSVPHDKYSLGNRIERYFNRLKDCVGLPRDTRKPPATSLASSRSSQFPSGSNSLTAPSIIAAQGTCSTPVLPSGDRQGQQDSIGPPANASCHDFSVVLVLKAIPRHPAGTAQLWQTPEARSQQLPLREV